MARELTPEEAAERRERNRRNLALVREAKAAKTAAPAEDADEALLREPMEDEGGRMDASPGYDDAAAERRLRLLADLPAEVAALITDEDLAKIEREETEKALAEQKKQALADVRSIARQYARIEHDLVPADVLRSEDERKRLAEKVRIRVDLPEGGGARGFRVDGRLLRNGMEYTVTRAEFESLNSTFYRAHLNEVQFSTLDQQKRGNSAEEVLSRRRPQLEVRDAA